jgi:hypothetical protein
MSGRPDTGENRMNIFEELRPQIEAFKDTRDEVVSSASLQPTDGAMGCGEPPFAVDDGTNYYAVIDENGDVKPFPFGYQVANEDMQDDGVDRLLSFPMSIAGKGLMAARYIPLVENFDIPGDRAFCLETAEDSVAWEAVGEAVDQLQQAVNERALFNFSQRLANAVSRLYEGCEELESVDQTISALFLEPSVLMILLSRSYQHALERIEEEMSAEEGDDDE